MIRIVDSTESIRKGLPVRHEWTTIKLSCYWLFIASDHFCLRTFFLGFFFLFLFFTFFLSLKCSVEKHRVDLLICLESFFGKNSTLGTETSERAMAINLKRNMSELYGYRKYLQRRSQRYTRDESPSDKCLLLQRTRIPEQSRAELQPCVINLYGDVDDGWWCKETVLGSGNLWESSPKTACRGINQMCAASKTIKGGSLVDKPVEK